MIVVGTEVSPGVNYQVNITPRIAGFYASNYQYAMRDNGTNFLLQSSVLLSNDIIQIAVNGTNMWLGKNNTWYDASGGTTGNPSTGANPTILLNGGTTYVPYVHTYLNTVKINFGQGGQSGLTYYPDAGGFFKYAPPTGFKTLSTKNLSDPVIKKPNEHFDIVTYTGNGGVLNITGLAFKPDFSWFKNRGAASQNTLIDSVRGVSKQLFSNLNNGEQTSVTGLSSFNSDGLSLNGNVNPTGDLNFATHSYVAWNWKGGGTAVTNTAGTITSEVSANPTAGISIISYTGNGVNGATVGHGLASAPKFYMTKNRDGYNNSQGYLDWSVYHADLPQYTGGSAIDSTAKQPLWLYSTSAASNGVGGFPKGPASTVITPNQTLYDNVLGKTFVTYAFSEVPGFSKFGTYTGNGSADGPFLYTGFKPRYIMIKKINSTSNWSIFDTARDTDNVVDLWLGANVSNSELTSPAAQTFDFLSSGIKIRGIGDDSNVSGATYIYAAFAETPLKYANAK